MDSANILSIMQSLGGSGAGQDPSQAPVQPPQAAPATNVLQAAATPPAPPQAAPAPVYQDPTAQIAQAATTASPPMPHQRSSLVNILGRISDVLATVGGAHPLYQPTLDAETARDTAAQNQALATQKANIDLATSKFDLSDKQREAGNDERSRFASVLDAVYDPEDAANLPAMMAAAGLTDARYAPFVKMVQDNPDVAKTLSGALGGGDANTPKYGGQPIPAIGPDGKFTYVQASLTGEPGRTALPPGYTAVDPTQLVDLGGQMGGVGKNTGLPKFILPKTEKPGFSGGEPTKEKPGFSGGEPTKEKPGFFNGRPIAPSDAANVASAKNGDPYTGYINGVNGIRALDKSLADLTGDPRLNEATGLVMGRTNITEGQRAIQAKIDSLIGQGIPAAIAAIKASGGAAPRSVAEIMGEVNGLVGPIKNRNQATPDYVATINAARNRLHQRLNEMGDNVVRQGIAMRDSNGNIGPAPKAAAAANSALPTLSPEDVAKLPSGHNIQFRTLDGRTRIRS